MKHAFPQEEVLFFIFLSVWLGRYGIQIIIYLWRCMCHFIQTYGKYVYVQEKITFFFLSNTNYFHNLSKNTYFFLTILFTVVIGKSIFIYIFFLIKHICLLLWHHLRELSSCNCLVIVVEKDYWSWSLMLVVVLHTLWGRGGKSGENFGYQGLSILAMTFKQTIKINPSLTIWNIWLCKSKKPTK